MFGARWFMPAVAAALAMTVLNAAEATEARGGGRRRGETGRAAAEERHTRFMERRSERLAEKLELDPATAARFVELLNGRMESRRTAMKAFHEEIKGLKELLERKAPAAELEARLQRIAAARQAMHDARTNEYAEIHALLGTEKTARFVILQQKQMGELRKHFGQGQGREREIGSGRTPEQRGARRGGRRR